MIVGCAWLCLCLCLASVTNIAIIYIYTEHSETHRPNTQNAAIAKDINLPWTRIHTNTFAAVYT